MKVNIPTFLKVFLDFLKTWQKLIAHIFRTTAVHASIAFLWVVFSTSDISYQMCYCCQKLESASHVRTFEADSVSEPIREEYLYIWGRNLASNVQNRPQMYRIGLKCTEFHTFEAEIIYFLMWCLSANQRTVSVHLRPIPYIWGR